MDFLASCSLAESKQYTGKLVVPAAEEGGKPGKVLLNILCDNGDPSLIKLIGGNIKSITYLGGMDAFADAGESFEDLPAGVFHEVSLEDFSVEDTPCYKGVTTLVRVPDGYHDMRTLYEMCERRPDVRVIGGYLLGIPGVRIGRFQGRESASPVYDGMYDAFMEVSLADLDNLTELVKKSSKKQGTAPKEPKPTKKKGSSPGETHSKASKIGSSFTTLFGEFSEEEF